MEQKDPLDGISDEDLVSALEDAMENIKQNTYTTPEVELSSDDIEYKSFTSPYEKYSYKVMNKKEYFPKDKDYYYGNNIPNGPAEQINALWQELKNISAQLTIVSKLLQQKDDEIEDLTEKLNNKDSDKFEEINDRLDDLESRIDLIDE